MDLSSVLDLQLSDSDADDHGPSKRARIEPGDLDDFAFPSCIFKDGTGSIMGPQFSQIWNTAMNRAIDDSPYSDDEKWIDQRLCSFWFYPRCLNCGLKLPLRRQKFQDMFCRRMCLELSRSMPCTSISDDKLYYVTFFSEASRAMQAPESVPLEDNPKVEVRQSTIPEAGNGLFAREPVRAGTTIGQYTGEVIDRSEAMARSEEGAERSHFLFDLGNGKYLDGKAFTNEMRWANHKPFDLANALVVKAKPLKRPRGGGPRIFLKAKEDIRTGQEIFFDYGPLFWNKGEKK